MSPEIICLIGLGIAIVLMMVGVPVAFALGGMGILLAWGLWGPGSFPMFAMRTYGVMTEYSLIAVPLFIFMGAILERSGVTERLFDVLYVVFGPVRGGLAMAAIVLAVIFGACTGIAGAAVITIGLIAMPAMLKRGYDKGLVAGTICSGGGLGVIIPPSIVFIIYGATAGVSISKLFASGIIPGVLLGGLYLIYIGVKYNVFQPNRAPSISPEERKVVPTLTLLRMIAVSLVPPIILIIAVLVSIFVGWAAPTEAASLGALGAVLVCAIYRRLTWQALKETVIETLRISSMMMFICLGANLFVGSFLKAGTGIFIGEAITGLGISPLATIIVMLGMLFIAGMFMDWIGIVFIFVPTFSPIVAHLGFDPIWFGALFCVTLQISYMTPPFAYSVFYLRSIAPPDFTIGEMYKGGLPFIVCQLVCLILLIQYPMLSLFIPEVVAG
jgi:tripartite ATP-independent transporter DctM subunit